MVKVRKTATGYLLPVILVPAAGRNELRGEHDGRLKVCVSAAPEKGKANKALCELIAATLGISRSQVKVVSGHTSRRKEVLIERVSTDALEGIIA